MFQFTELRVIPGSMLAWQLPEAYRSLPRLLTTPRHPLRAFSFVCRFTLHLNMMHRVTYVLFFKDLCRSRDGRVLGRLNFVVKRLATIVCCDLEMIGFEPTTSGLQSQRSPN